MKTEKRIPNVQVKDSYENLAMLEIDVKGCHGNFKSPQSNQVRPKTPPAKAAAASTPAMLQAAPVWSVGAPSVVVAPEAWAIFVASTVA